MRNQIQYHAPYSYLTRFEPDGPFHLFVTVPVREGYRLAAPDTSGIQYRNGMTQIDIYIVPQSGAPASTENFHFALRSEDATPFPPNLDSDEIVVTVAVFENDVVLESSYHSTTLYRDSDNEAVSTAEIDAKVVFNSPYVHLKRLEASEAGAAQANYGMAFEPYLLMHLNGYVQNPDQVNITTPDNGIYEAIIVLSNTEERINEPVTEYNFAVNGNHYYDSGRIEGNFAITVIMENDIAANDSLSRKSASELHKALWDIDNGTTVDTSAAGGRNLNAPKRKKAKTRNMSSRRRSNFLIDFRTPAE